MRGVKAKITTVTQIKKRELKSIGQLKNTFAYKRREQLEQAALVNPNTLIDDSPNNADNMSEMAGKPVMPSNYLGEYPTSNDNDNDDDEGPDDY